MSLFGRLKKEVDESFNRYDPTLRSAFWRNLAFRNPLMVAVLTALFAPPGGYWRYAAIALCIATLVNTFCFLAVELVCLVLAAWARHHGREAAKRAPRWYWAISGLALPPSLSLAFFLTGLICDRFGLPWEPPSSLDYRIGLLFGAIFMLIFYLSKTRGEARENARKLENERLRAQLAALTAQMNPHLFFNALNTVASFIATEPRRAEETLVTLADLYRSVLSATQREQHSLAEELALCRAYLELEKARFGDRLRVRFAIDDTLPLAHCRLPVLTLQPLVENAVKHGVAPRAGGGAIAVGARREGEFLCLSVEDDGLGFGRSGHSGNGRALENCRARLELSFGARAALEIRDRAPGTAIVLRLPWEEMRCEL